MIKIPSMTLICIENKRVPLAVRAMNQAQAMIEFGDAILFTDQDVKINGRLINYTVNSTVAYSDFMINHLHKYIETPLVMVVQWDGFPLNSAAWNPEFIEYDYIGAPWTPGYNKIAGMPDCTEHTCIGNGGFSIRSKKLLDSVFKITNGRKDIHPEDVYVVRAIRKELEEDGIRFAPRHLGERFSVEDNYYTGQFGFHGRQTIMMNPFLRNAYPH